MESEINFYYKGDYDQAMDIARTMMPSSAKNREVRIVLDTASGVSRIKVSFINNHVYPVDTKASEFFNPEGR